MNSERSAAKSRSGTGRAKKKTYGKPPRTDSDRVGHTANEYVFLFLRPRHMDGRFAPRTVKIATTTAGRTGASRAALPSCRQDASSRRQRPAAASLAPLRTCLDVDVIGLDAPSKVEGDRHHECANAGNRAAPANFADANDTLEAHAIDEISVGRRHVPTSEPIHDVGDWLEKVAIEDAPQRDPQVLHVADGHVSQALHGTFQTQRELLNILREVWEITHPGHGRQSTRAIRICD
mmetsp:Transcript_50777/g.147902  ORF Transcript_50777/g.147902 Transcript_50777/m.147902 type:complete len:235 (+) Transcript_50777:176-880(+)